MMISKIKYIHENPVKRGYVDEATHWRYSSSRDYEGIERWRDFGNLGSCMHSPPRTDGNEEMLSADLFELINESQSMFEEVSKIQVPNLVPFENFQMEQKYRELTEKLR